MKKKIAAIAILIFSSAFLGIYPNLSTASAEKEIPSNINGAVAFDFDSLSDVTYGAETTNMFYDTLGTDVTGITAELVNDSGNKAVKLNMASDYSSPIILRNTYGGRVPNSSWPDTSCSPKGLMIKVSTGAQPVSFRMGFQLAIRGGVFTNSSGQPLAEGTTFRFFPGTNAPETIKLFDTSGANVNGVVDTKYGYNATVTIPADFSGYLVYDFTTLYMEGGASYTPVNGVDQYYQKVSADDILWFNSSFSFTYYFDSGVKGGTHLTLDDYGYLTGEEKEIPYNLHSSTAFDFDSMNSVTYGAETTNMFYDTLGTSVTGITAELVNDNGNKAVKLNMASDYSSAITLRNTYGGRSGTSNWPSESESPKGIMIQVSTGAQPVSFRMGFNLAIKGGVFTNSSGQPLAEGTTFRFFPGIDAPDTIKLFDAYGYRVAGAVNNKSNYNATVTIPANFSGYLIYDFSTLYLEGGASYTPVNGIERYDQKVSANDILWFGSSFNFTYYFDSGVKGGTHLMLDNYGYLTESPADEPLQSDLITGGNIPASGGLDSAWKFRKDSADPISGRIITYLGGYKNIDGAAYLIKRTADSSNSYFMYQEFPIENFYSEKLYTLNAYMRGYQINKNVSNLPDQYGTYLYVEFVNGTGDVIDTAVDYSSKMPFGISDWNLYSLSFQPNIPNTASIRVGILTDSIICETAIDDVTLTYEHSILPDYTGNTTKTTDTTVTLDGQLNPNSGSSKDFDPLFQAEASIMDNVVPSPSPDATTASPSETPAISPTNDATSLPTKTDNTNPPTGFAFPTILGLALAGVTFSGIWFIKRKLNGGGTV